MVRNAYGIAIYEKNRRFVWRKLDEKNEKVIKLVEKKMEKLRAYR